MSMETIKADTIEQYNRFFGFQTRHPSVAVVHFDRAENQPAYKMTFGFYALFLKKTVGCTINYGKTKYDYDDETVVSFAPGQTVGIHRIEDGPVPEAVGLLFHPDFLHRTPLAQKMRQYTFFSYASNEALHLSVDERVIVQDYRDKIARELEHPIDKFSKPLIVSNIEVLLNYCMRFYERQFITREELNNDVLVRFERLLDDYWDSGMAERYGLPTVKYFADKICLSPNYFGDLRKGQERPVRAGNQHKAGRRPSRLPVSAAFPAFFQEGSRLYAEGVSFNELICLLGQHVPGNIAGSDVACGLAPGRRKGKSLSVRLRDQKPVRGIFRGNGLSCRRGGGSWNGHAYKSLSTCRIVRGV